MRNVLLLAGVAAAWSTVASGQGATAEVDVKLGRINNQYICTFDRSVPGEAVRNEAAKAAGPMMGEVLHVYRHSIKGFAVRLPAQPGSRNAMAELRANNPKITGCEQDQLVKAFARPAGKPGGGGSTGEQTPWGITRVGGAGQNAGNTAWVIDSGIDLDHPDLNVNSSVSVSYVGGDADDKNGHGTHVAGTIAAICGNNIGVVGVSPGTTVVSVRVLNGGGTGSNSGVIAGVDWVAGHGGPNDVANMSLGGGASSALDQAVLDASAASGVAFTLAAGNESDDARNHSPARAGGASSTDEVYAVAAFAQRNDAFASFSNFGPAVEWSEPGVSILSTYKGGGLATMSGTSMAAPHLAGILVQGGVSQCGSTTGEPAGTLDRIGCH